MKVGRRYDAALRQVKECRRDVRIEYGMPAPDGQQFYEARFVSFHRDQVIVIVRDVTERRRAENSLARARDNLEIRIRERTEELTQVNASLRESEERAHSILNAVQAGVLIVDPATHRIVDANPAALRMIGIALDQVVGRGEWITMYAPRKRGSVRSPISR